MPGHSKFQNIAGMRQRTVRESIDPTQGLRQNVFLFGPLGRIREAIPDMAVGAEIPGIGGIVAELLA
jgi:hypothetical protein